MTTGLSGDDVTLRRTEGGLVLTDGRMEIKADFAHMAGRLRKDNLRRELLVKAAKLKTPCSELTVLDATAGFGEDALLLAAVGYQVTLCEKDPVIAALLRDALCRASEQEVLREAVSRMTLIETDSIAYMKQIQKIPDIIYLDPMFPERQKSALVKKKFQLLHHLESPCDEEETLLETARSKRPYKIVIKRPLKGPYLAGVKPSYSLSGKAIRYDVIVCSHAE